MCRFQVATRHARRPAARRTHTSEKRMAPTAAATRYILEHSPVNEIYNISSGFHTENMNVVKTVCKSLGLKVEDVVEYVTDRLGHDFKYSVSADKLKALGFEIESRFQDDIEEIIDHEFDRVRHSS